MPDGRDPRLPETPETIVVYSDLNCSFAHLAVHRLWETRDRLGLTGRIWIDHRAFPLELFNLSVNERPGVESEIAVLGGLEPQAGWRMWTAPDWTYPVTTLPALEAVQAAKEQGREASEHLDRALRRAFWAESQCISMRHVIAEVAAATPEVDAGALLEALDSGRARPAVLEQYRTATGGRVDCSPHLFLHDGMQSSNPGVRAHWANGGFGEGFPVIDSDTPAIYQELLEHAAGLQRIPAG